jgi:hypothetical protein
MKQASRLICELQGGEMAKTEQNRLKEVNSRPLYH